MHLEQPSRSIVIELVLVLLSAGCALAPAGPDAAAAAAAAAQPQKRDKDWWNKTKNRREFVPGKGYVVAGVSGFFDENGHPVQETQSVQTASFTAATTAPTVPVTLATSQPDKPSIYSRLLKAIGAGPDETEARQLYADGDALFGEQRYKQAAGKFKQAAKRWPDSLLEQDAMFMQAESYFFADEYPRANDTYEAILKKYPSSRRLDTIIRRQFAIARYWQQFNDLKPHWPVTPNITDKTRQAFDTIGHALRVYENIRLNDPTGPLADDALMATANIYFKLGRYEDADYHYGLLRREYPRSEHQFEAHLLGLQSKLRKYQGPDYDGTSLDEAAKLAEQLATQFPDRVGSERERVQKMQAEVAAQKALRDWTRAEYYAKGKYYGAAKSYYEKIVAKHPDSKLAEQSRARLAALGSQPDRPPQRLAWLTNLFPESAGSTAVASRPGGHVSHH